jgi:benzodiazapine receptor
MRAPRDWRSLIWALALSYATAGLGGALTDLGPWYQGLKQPDWKPPDMWFGPIWSTIFTLVAISAWWAWHDSVSPVQRQRIGLLFGLNAVLNVAWSALFFTLQRPDWSMVEWAALWLSVGSLVVFVWPISRRAALLNLPYWCWVSIAGGLNWENVVLNGPFA